LGASEEDIGRRRPVGGFGVTRCDYAQLLVGFIVLALGDPVRVRSVTAEELQEELSPLFLTLNRLLNFGRHGEAGKYS